MVTNGEVVVEGKIWSAILMVQLVAKVNPNMARIHNCQTNLVNPTSSSEYGSCAMIKKLKHVYYKAIIMQKNKNADIQGLIKKKIKEKNNNVENESCYK